MQVSFPCLMPKSSTAAVRSIFQGQGELEGVSIGHSLPQEVPPCYRHGLLQLEADVETAAVKICAVGKEHF